MSRHPSVIAHVLLLLAPVALGAGCGGDAKKPVAKPVAKQEKKPAPKVETEEDRVAKRLAAAQEIIPEGSTCLPTALKEAGAPRLELAAVGTDAVVCAIDTDETRLLGPVGCWKVDLASGELAYQQPAPLPGHSVAVLLDGDCARGYCLPEDAAAPEGKPVHLVWNQDGSKAAVLAGETVHLFDASGKAHESSFSIRGAEGENKGVPGEPTALHWVGEVLFVEGAGDVTGVWAFKQDGAPVGPLEAIGSKDGKPLSLVGGSVSVLDKDRIAVAQQGFSTVTTYEANTGKRAKLVRKLTKPPCKTAELTAFWAGNEGVGAKCQAAMTKQFGHLIGATAVAGAKSFLVLLRGNRLGELGVLDAKSLAEKKAIKMPWCPAEETAAADGATDDGADE